MMKCVLPLFVIVALASCFSYKQVPTNERHIPFYCDSSAYVKRYKGDMDSIYFLCSVHTVEKENKSYQLLRMGLGQYDSIGYFRREGERILYLDYQYNLLEYPNHPGKQEQVVMDFSLAPNYALIFYGEGMFSGRNYMHVKNITLSSINREEIFHFVRIDTLSSWGLHGCNLLEMKIGKKSGFLEFTYQCENGKLRFYRKLEQENPNSQFWLEE